MATTVFPDWIGRIAPLLPIYHGLLGVRSLLADGYSADAISSLGIELAVGVEWYLLGLAGLRAFAERGRASGSIVMSE